MADFIEGFITALVVMLKVVVFAAVAAFPIIITAATKNGKWMLAYVVVIPITYGLICAWGDL